MRPVYQTQARITHLLCKVQYHYTADLLFNLFGFSNFAYVELETYLIVWSNQN